MAEWTYPSAMFAMIPYGIEPVPVAMDSQGIRSDMLHKLLSEWDEGAHNMPRYVISKSIDMPQRLTLFSPHVMYTVPVGQNPSGAVSNLRIQCMIPLLSRFHRLWVRLGRRKYTIFVCNTVRPGRK